MLVLMTVCSLLHMTERALVTTPWPEAQLDPVSARQRHSQSGLNMRSSARRSLACALSFIASDHRKLALCAPPAQRLAIAGSASVGE